MSKEYISFDTETTGFSFNKGDKIVEIGAVKIKDGIITDTYQQYINPERSIPAKVIKVHGITDDKVKNEPLFHEIIDDFMDFIKGCTLVAHNAKFDIEFMGSEINNDVSKGNTDKSVLDSFVDFDVIDTMEYSKKAFKKGRHNLNALAERFEIDHSHRDFHGALLDADLLAQVFIEINGGDQLSLISQSDSFNVKRADDYLGSLQLKKSSKVSFSPRALPPLTEKELEAHKIMMDRIKKESGNEPIGNDSNWLSETRLENKEEKIQGKPLQERSSLQSPNFRL